MRWKKGGSHSYVCDMVKIQFFLKFCFKNECKNEVKDGNDKLCS